MTKLRVSIAVARARLSMYLRQVEEGDIVVLTRRNQPVAEIRRVIMKRRRRRPIGLCAGEFVVPADFDAPLPDDLLDTFDRR